MAPTVTRLILSFALIVATPTLFFLLLFIGYQVFDDLIDRFFNYDEELFFIPISFMSVGFFGFGWWLIWRGEVTWTAKRKLKTWCVLGASMGLSALAAVLIAAVFRHDGEIIGSMLGGLVWIVLWLFGTAWAWRETSAERAGRLAAMGVEALPCPSCGYNLSGLRESKCPECGSAFTLDQLYAAVDEQRRPMARG